MAKVPEVTGAVVLDFAKLMEMRKRFRRTGAVEIGDDSEKVRFKAQKSKGGRIRGMNAEWVGSAPKDEVFLRALRDHLSPALLGSRDELLEERCSAVVIQGRQITRLSV